MSGRYWLCAWLICGAAVAQQQGSSAADVWTQYMDRGRALETSGQYAEAKQLFQSAIEAAAGFPPKDARRFASLLEMGNVTASMGQYIEAEDWDNEAVRLGVGLYGKDASELSIPFNNLAALYRDQGDYGRAEQFCRRALGVLAAQPAAPARAHVLGTLGGILFHRDKLAEAEATLRESIQIAETLPPPSAILGGDLSNLAGVYAKSGRSTEALTAFHQAYDLIEQAGGRQDPNLFYVLAGIASVEAGAGHYADAVTAVESGIQVAEAGGVVNTLLIRDALAAEAGWLHKLKREGQAKRVRAKAKRVAEVAARNSYLQGTLNARPAALPVPPGQAIRDAQ